MDYLKIYHSIIENSKNRTLPDNTYTEKHHIISRSVFGEGLLNPYYREGDLYHVDDNNNISILTFREHIFVYKLLSYGTPESESMFKAYKAMIWFTYKSSKYNNREIFGEKFITKLYEEAKAYRYRKW